MFFSFGLRFGSQKMAIVDELSGVMNRVRTLINEDLW
jgi:hypothetical protein